MLARRCCCGRRSASISPLPSCGKVFGLGAADPALLAWTALGVALFLALAVSRVASLRAATVVVLVLVFFSGMDLVGTVLRGGLELAGNLRITDHLEWWAERFQYSSNTTQLFWVPNHALAGWIATALLVRHADRPEFARILPLLVALVPIWSPLTAVGFLPLAGAWWLQQLVRERSLRLVDPVAVCAAVAIALVTGAYLVMGATTIPSGVTVQAGESMLDLPAALPAVRAAGGRHPLVAAACLARGHLADRGRSRTLDPALRGVRAGQRPGHARFHPGAGRPGAGGRLSSREPGAGAAASGVLAHCRGPAARRADRGDGNGQGRVGTRLEARLFPQSGARTRAQSTRPHYATRLTGSPIERLLSPSATSMT